MQGLKIKRKEMGLTQAKLSERIGVSRTSVKHWETSRAMPSLTNLMALEELFDCKIKDLI